MSGIYWRIERVFLTSFIYIIHLKTSLIRRIITAFKTPLIGHKSDI